MLNVPATLQTSYLNIVVNLYDRKLWIVNLNLLFKVNCDMS